MWCWIVEHADVLSALSTVVLAVLTLVYVILTRKLAKTAMAGQRPAIWLDLEVVSPSNIFFTIGNGGSTPARNVRFKVKDKFYWGKAGNSGTGVKGLQVVKEGIPYIPPGRVWKYDVGEARLPSSSDSDNECKIDIELTFDSDLEKGIKRKFVFDIATFRGVLLQSFKK